MSDHHAWVAAIHAACVERITLTEAAAARWFKLGPGDYAEHERFLGVTVPNLRKIAAQYQASASLPALSVLLTSAFNEERLLALLMLVQAFKSGGMAQRQDIYDFYLAHLAQINNWNLVDASAHLIIGAWLWDKDRSILRALAQDSSLWVRRIAIVATWYFINNGDTSTTFSLADYLINDPALLVRKALGWILREAGKCNEEELWAYLRHNISRLPAITLRIASERLCVQRMQQLKTGQG